MARAGPIAASCESSQGQREWPAHPSLRSICNDAADGQRPGCSSSEAGQSLVEDTTANNWLTPLRRPGSVVALGKFDALHRGHRALALAAASLAREIAARPASAAGPHDACNGASSSGRGGGTSDATGLQLAQQAGSPPSRSGAVNDSSTGGDECGDAVLLSFSGMAAVLGWPQRLPLTAPQDRARVLASWAGTACGAAGTGAAAGLGGEGAGATSASTSAPAAAPAARPPRLRTLPFSLIRGMSPEQFVALLARDLGAAGVVAGRNYRFGYKAAGDADTLLRLGQQYGMRVQIVDLVTLPDSDDSGASGQATTTSSSSTSSNSVSDSGAPTGYAARPCNRAIEGDPVELEQQGCSRHPAFALDASTDLDVELPARDAQAACGAVAGGSGGGASERDGSCTRVSSSRIRELLAAGRVEAVERLLGRKYRLVCTLEGAGAAPTAAWAAAPEGSGAGGHGDRAAAGPGSVGASAGGFFLPHSAYQNQPSANGQYRALVRLVASAGGDANLLTERPIGSRAAWTAQAGGHCQGAGSDLNGSLVHARASPAAFGPACVMVSLSDAGLHVDSASLGLGVQGIAEANGAFLVIDFDACG